jgi:hypothetical protein
VQGWFNIHKPINGIHNNKRVRNQSCQFVSIGIEM